MRGPPSSCGHVALALAAFLLGGCPSAEVEPRAPTATCDASERGRVEQWLREGRLDRARRDLESAGDRCPTWGRERSRTLLRVLYELGDVEAFAALRARLVAEGETGLLRPPAGVAEPLAEMRAGLGAEREGRRGEARRLFDRARVGFRRKGMAETIVALRLGPRVVEGERWLAFVAEDGFQPLRPRRSVEAITGPFAVFDRASFEPRYFFEGDALPEEYDEPAEKVLGPPSRSLATRDALEAAMRETPPPEVSVRLGTVAWASDVASASFLNVWSVRDGWLLRESGAFCRPALGPGAETVAAARCRDADEVVVRHLRTGERRVHALPFRVEGLALSAQGERLLAWGAEGVALLEPFDGGVLSWSAPSALHGSAVLAPDGKSVLAIVPGGFDLWWLPGASPMPASAVVFSIPCSGPVRYLDARRVRCGDEVIDLREPRAMRTPAPASSGPSLVVEDGRVSLRDTDGRRLGRIYSDGPRGAFARLEDGSVDPMGDEHPALLCRYGDVLAPLVVCGDRWLAEGGLQRLWAAAPSSRGLSPTR